MNTGTPETVLAATLTASTILALASIPAIIIAMDGWEESNIRKFWKKAYDLMALCSVPLWPLTGIAFAATEEKEDLQMYALAAAVVAAGAATACYAIRWNAGKLLHKLIYREARNDL